MTWMYILFGIILLGCGLWGWIARLKWMEEQGRESKKTNKFITPFSHF